jgi:hypothetical protein
MFERISWNVWKNYLRSLKKLHKIFVRFTWDVWKNYKKVCKKLVKFFFCPIERNNLTEKVFENSIRRVNTILALRPGPNVMKLLMSVNYGF